MTNTKTMDLLEIPPKIGSIREVINKVGSNHLDQLPTGQILWHLVKRHKFQLVSAWAIVITIAYMFPPLWDILGSLVK